MSSLNVREMEQRDVPDMVRLAIATGLFPLESSSFLEGAAKSWFDGGPGQWLVDEVDGAVVGIAFYEPRPASYDRTRRFYAKLAYDAVARVPDYFDDGDDMVLFSKDLRRSTAMDSPTEVSARS